VVAALMFGVIATSLLAFAPSIFRESFQSWDAPQGRTLSTQSHPTYLHDLVPEYSETRLIRPDHEFCGGRGRARIFLHLVDTVEYLYGDFDTSTDGWIGVKPPGAKIIRTRFGWPVKAMYIDDIAVSYNSESALPTPQQFNEFFAQAKQRSGFKFGVLSPDFFPCKTPKHRIPIAPIWTGWLIDVAFWSVLWLLFGSALQTLIHRLRSRRNRCRSCGYLLKDLTYCPECGTCRD
jgi:hypothetical protein